MKGNPGHIEDIYAIIYIRYMAYIYYGVDKDVIRYEKEKYLTN